MAINVENLLTQERFVAPDGLNIDTFQTASGRSIRYAHLTTDNAKTTIVIFPGMSEFIEKYFELLHTLQAWGYNVFVFDWPNQGLSTRYIDTHPMRRHSLGFDTELADVYEMLQSTLPKNIPLYMLGHSMGGHMALRYFQSYIDPRFQKLALSAPMLDINIPPAPLKAIAPSLARFFVLLGMENNYVFGGRDWNFDYHSKNAEVLSHDPDRNMLHRGWYIKNTHLQLGSPTFGWLHQAFLSRERLADTRHLSNIDMPVLMLTAEHDAIVDNAVVPHYVEHIPNIEHHVIEGAYHELLMESDPYRNRVLDKLKSFFASS